VSERSFYDVLGVARDSDEKTLKSAFRKKAMEYHPDRNPGCTVSEAKFKELSEAYETLSDPQKRALYDRFGKQGLNGMGAGGGMGGRPEDVMRDAFGDIFAEFFGAQRQSRSGPARGADLRYDYAVSLEEAFAGKTAEINVPTTERCGDCAGAGAEAGTQPESCTACNGQGRVRVQQGFFTMERTCGRCQGAGQVIKHPCKTCSGRGAVRRERTLTVTIPAGIEDGQQMRLAGEGESGGKGGPNGHLYIFVSVTEHEIFERDGQTLYARAPVPMTTAALGGEIELPTIDGGRTRIAIPEGAQTGKRLRLRGKGMPSVRGGPMGDLFVEIVVETPRDLSPRQKELLREFSKQCSDKSHPDSHGFFTRVKKFFDQDDSRA
jgi:molecular chaperone DnaJ